LPAWVSNLAAEFSFLPVSGIRWIGVEENYVRLTTNGGAHLLKETMMNLDGKLDPQTFLRVHRSIIVNLQHVKEVRTDKQGDMAVILDDGEGSDEPNLSRSPQGRVARMRRRCGLFSGSVNIRLHPT
jgi:two-component system LytT family response regulator